MYVGYIEVRRILSLLLNCFEVALRGEEKDFKEKIVYKFQISTILIVLIVNVLSFFTLTKI